MALQNVKEALKEALGMKNQEPCECGGEAILVSIGASIDLVDPARGPNFEWQYQCKKCGKILKKSEKSKKTRK
jgi:hypothetical protein